jgi:transposase InsO family protein
MRTEQMLDAILIARWGRDTHHENLRCHSDAGPQFTSVRYGEHLAKIGATPSIGTVVNSHDDALAETLNGDDNTEVDRGPERPSPGRAAEDPGLATLGWVLWLNTLRLHSDLGDGPPAKFEQTFYADQTPLDEPVGIKQR